MVAGISPYTTLWLCPFSTSFSAGAASPQSISCPPASCPPFSGPSQAAARLQELDLGSKPGHGCHPIALYPEPSLLRSGSPHHLSSLPHALTSFVGGQGAAMPQTSTKEGQQPEWLLNIEGSHFPWLRASVIQNYGQPKNPESWTVPTLFWLALECLLTFTENKLDAMEMWAILGKLPRIHWKNGLTPTGHSFLLETDGVTHLTPLPHQAPLPPLAFALSC